MASQLPPGFNDPVPFANYRSHILGICIALMTICWLAVAARLYHRLFVAKSLGWDDFFVVAAISFVSTGTIVTCVATNYGLGKHIYLLQPKDISKILLCNYIMAASYNGSTALIKISLLFQYLRVFERGTWTYRCALLLLVVISLWGFAYSFIAWFSCLPNPSAAWGNQNGCYGGASKNKHTVIRVIEAQAGSNFAFDILVLLLAFRLRFALSAKTAREVQATKVGMMVLIFLGSFSCVFAAWRLAVMVQADAGQSSDISWSLAKPTLLSLCEVYIAVLVASIPFFWPMLKEQINKIFVSYEFTVTNESRFNQENSEDGTNELSGLESGNLGKSLGTEANSLESKSVDSQSYQYHANQYHPDDYTGPFLEDYGRR